jgi:cyclic pyranopterin phosphate synthase
MEVSDLLGRRLRDLRVSVTDRCNFRCAYCMPKEVFGPGFRFLPHADVLTFEEIVEVVTAAVSLGARKVRLTGGEPLLRRGLADLVGMVAAVPGVEDLAMTTNGALLERYAESLAAAGLRRVTVSLDSLDPQVFRAMNGVEVELDQVLRGLEAARRSFVAPIKLNTVVRRGVNDSGVLALAEFARESGHILRLIEYMDVGESHGWRMEEVVPARDVVAMISARWPLDPVSPSYRGEVASRFRSRDGGGEVGVISTVSAPFCGACTRLRLSADGRVHTCLFSRGGIDLRPLLRPRPRPGAVEEALKSLWMVRQDRYSEERSDQAAPPLRPKVEMSYLGG